MKDLAVIYGGGTISHVRPHLALVAPAYGTTAKHLAKRLQQRWDTRLELTRMAGGRLETNQDVDASLKAYIKDPRTKVIVMSAALCDFKGSVDGESGKDAPRLDSSIINHQIDLTPADKLIGQIRKERKDIFLVGFKTVAGASKERMVERGMTLLKQNSCNLVMVNDVQTRFGGVLTPEMALYGYSDHRPDTLTVLESLILKRAGLTFTQTTMGPEALQPWAEVPETLRRVVDHCVDQDAYKPFRGVTVGHFGYLSEDGALYSSRRKQNFNNPINRDLVRVEFSEDKVIAGGHKPSAGARSQYSILTPQYDCVVHFHCPLRKDHPDPIPQRSQLEFECGSHECGINTKTGLARGEILPGVRATMLDKHGPNIIFHHSTDPQSIIDFIDRNFDLSKQAGFEN